MQIAIRSNVIYIVIIMTKWHDKYATDRQYYQQSVMVSVIIAQWFSRAKLMPMSMNWNEQSDFSLKKLAESVFHPGYVFLWYLQ